METKKITELGCNENIIKALSDMGFEETTPIQTLAIPVVLNKKDVVGQAQTGTGKTAAFGIPALDCLEVNKKNPQVLILCPTRELAVQVADEIMKMTKYMKGIKSLAVFGGQSIERQINALKKGVHIVIGTPGRVMDHMRRKTLKMTDMKMLVLDEADEMMKMGFREDIEFVLSNIEQKIQKLLFSATMPKAILDIVKKYLDNPEILKVKHKQLTSPNIEQKYLEVKERDKVEVMSRLIDMYNPKLTIVFCNTKRKVDETVEHLITRGYMVDKIHGDMRQQQRINILNRFKRKDLEMLVATDVAARGIDVDDVEMVLNYDVPTHEEFYVHRIGRTGRAGRKGRAFSLVTSKDYKILRGIMRYSKANIEKHNIPSALDIENIKKDNFVNELRNEIDNSNLSKYIKMIEEISEDNYSPLEIAAALIKKELEFDLSRKEIKDTSNFESSKDDRRSDGRNSRNNSRGKKAQGEERLFINIGRNKNINPKDIVGAITDGARVKGKDIGVIDIYDKYTFVNVSESIASKIVNSMNNNTIRGNKVSVEIANGGRKRKR